MSTTAKPKILRLRDTQLDSGGGGALSQGAGHDGSFFR